MEWSKQFLDSLRHSSGKDISLLLALSLSLSFCLSVSCSCTSYLIYFSQHIDRGKWHTLWHRRAVKWSRASYSGHGERGKNEDGLAGESVGREVGNRNVCQHQQCCSCCQRLEGKRSTWYLLLICCYFQLPSLRDNFAWSTWQWYWFWPSVSILSGRYFVIIGRCILIPKVEV